MRILDLIFESLCDKYEPIRFATKRDPDISQTEIVATMLSMYTNRVAGGGDSICLRGKGRESTMTACSDSKVRYDNCSKPGSKKSSMLQISARVC